MEVYFYFRVTLSDPTDDIVKNKKKSDYFCETCDSDVGSDSKHCH